MATGDHLSYPVLASGPDPITVITAWTWGLWTEVIPASTLTTPIAIEGVVFLEPPATGGASSRHQANISVGKGAISSEVEIIQFPVTWMRFTVAEHMHAPFLWLPEGVEVAADQRISIRVAHQQGVVSTYGLVKLFYKELAVAGVDTLRPRQNIYSQAVQTASTW